MNNSLQNPTYCCLFLSKTKNNTIRFSIAKTTSWIIEPEANTIRTNTHYLSINISKNFLEVSKRKTKWILNNNLIFHKACKLYITCDYKYALGLTKDPKEALQFTIEKDSIYYIKSVFQLDFERKTLELNLRIPRFPAHGNSKGPSIGILLAGGISSRFNASKPKQLYLLNNKPVLSYSIEAILPAVDRLVIVSNTFCYEEIYNLTINKPNISIVINDIHCRLESIAAGIEFSKYLNPRHVIIHDSARPYITTEHIEALLESNKSCVYSQYFLKLVNGLVSLSPKPEFVDRDSYIEACTPLCIQFDVLAFMIRYMQIEHRIAHEFLPFLNLFKLKYTFIEGTYNSLRKLTTLEDIA